MWLCILWDKDNILILRPRILHTSCCLPTPLTTNQGEPQPWNHSDLKSKDGNGSGFDPPRPAPFRDLPKKTRLLPRPICFNGYPFNPTCRIPDGYPTRFFFSLNFMQWAEAQKPEGEVPATRHQSSLGPLGLKLKN